MGSKGRIREAASNKRDGHIALSPDGSLAVILEASRSGLLWRERCEA